MNANIFASAISKVKNNPKPLTHVTGKQSKEEQKVESDILSRIKKPKELRSCVMKDSIGGRSQRLKKSQPYEGATADSVKKVLGNRFVPKSELIEVPWKHDLSPIDYKKTFRVFIRCLPLRATNDHLRVFFQKYGEITGVQVYF